MTDVTERRWSEHFGAMLQSRSKCAGHWASAWGELALGSWRPVNQTHLECTSHSTGTAAEFGVLCSSLAWSEAQLFHLTVSGNSSSKMGCWLVDSMLY